MTRRTTIPHRFSSLAIPTYTPPVKGVSIETLDTWFSKYIRFKFTRPYSDSVDTRVGNCFTCRKLQVLTALENGHYIGRQHFATRWEVKNCRPQCNYCNQRQEGEKGKFRKNLVEIYGEEVVSQMEALRRTAKKPTASETLILRDKFKAWYNFLKTGKQDPTGYWMEA